MSAIFYQTVNPQMITELNDWNNDWDNVQSIIKEPEEVTETVVAKELFEMPPDTPVYKIQYSDLNGLVWYDYKGTNPIHVEKIAAEKELYLLQEAENKVFPGNPRMFRVIEVFEHPPVTFKLYAPTYIQSTVPYPSGYWKHNVIYKKLPNGNSKYQTACGIGVPLHANGWYTPGPHQGTLECPKCYTKKVASVVHDVVTVINEVFGSTYAHIKTACNLTVDISNLMDGGKKWLEGTGDPSIVPVACPVCKQCKEMVAGTVTYGPAPTFTVGDAVSTVMMPSGGWPNGIIVSSPVTIEDGTEKDTA
jgi:hypothetical protein